jgi:hypothetical protein
MFVIFWGPLPKVSFVIEEQESPKMNSMLISFPMLFFQGIQQYNLCLVFYPTNGICNIVHQEYEDLCSLCVYHLIGLNFIFFLIPL